MAQHFLLSAKARTLSLTAVARMTDDEAHASFQAIRWADNGGEPFCPRCDCTAIYAYASRRIWKCKACLHQFSVTSGTIFASRKLPVRDHLLAIAIFVNGAKGHSALQLSRDLDVQYKTAFVMAHKIREAIGAEQAAGSLSGVVEVDGAYFGGHVKQENEKADRKDRRLPEEQNGKRQSVVVARQRGGRTLTTVVAKEADAAPFIRANVQPGTTVHADEAAGWSLPRAAPTSRAKSSGTGGNIPSGSLDILMLVRMPSRRLTAFFVAKRIACLTSGAALLSPSSARTMSGIFAR